MKKPINRRDFLKTTGAAASFVTINSSFFALNACNSGSAENKLFQYFQSPPPEAKPFYRWWWNGNRVTKQEVIRELEMMKSAGAGGVEINPIAINPEIKNPSGIPLDWLSDEWLDVLKTAIDKNKELGMITDLIIGTGWPFGGEFLNDEETIQGFDIYSQKISGPANFSFNKTILKEGAVIQQVRLSKIPITGMEDSVEITDEIKKGSVKIPAGNYEISVISWRNKFREVANGAPGGDGPVLDHFNQIAVEKYLERTSAGLKPVFGENMGNTIRSMFCDSIELEGANWTGDFREEFKRRNDYDIWEYLPLILNVETEAEGDFADILLRVRYDYYSTLSNLFMERFILPFHNWCHEIGVQSRYQAYGHPWIPTDLLDGNLIPDIPEGDQWLFNGGWTSTPIDEIRYAIWDKYTSSAAHLRGLKIASCEAMTNTSGVYSASLEYVKQATDLNVVAGINHLVLHGWNYSPPEAGFPGWVRFGTWFNEKNPWFPYLKLWSDYAARLNAVFQNSQAICQVAIIGPTADRWSEKGLDRNPFLLEPWYLHSIWQAMNHHGYCSDYLNPRVFSEAKFENGTIKIGPMSYQVLIVCSMQLAFPEFVDSLYKYAANGGKIIFIGKIPEQSPGLKMKGDSSVKEKMKTLLSEFPENITRTEEPVRGNINDLTKWTGEILSQKQIQPGVTISVAHERLYLYQSENEGNQVFFFSNQNRDKPIDFDATFNSRKLYPWKWDAESGEKYRFPAEAQKVAIHLKPLESLLLIFSEEKGEIQQTKKTPAQDQTSSSNQLDISGDWKAELIPVEGATFFMQLPVLADLSGNPETETFGGTIIYRKTFSARNQTKLELGKVSETAEVTLNGKYLGVKWWGEKTFDISGVLINGENRLEIKVTTLLWNYCNSKTMDENPMAKLWANRNRRKDNKPLSAGLIGPVRIS